MTVVTVPSLTVVQTASQPDKFMSAGNDQLPLGTTGIIDD